MLLQFIKLEWKSFFRSAALPGNLALKIISFFFAVLFIILFLFLGIGAFYILKEETSKDPLRLVNQFLIYYLFADLLMKYFLQKNPVLQIKPLMTLPVKKSLLIGYTLGKSASSFYNLIHAFFFLPFSIVLVIEGYAGMQVLLWHIGIVAIIYTNNFLNILINKKDNLLYAIAAIVIAAAALHYYSYLDITAYTAPFFDGLYDNMFVVLIPVAALFGIYKATSTFYKRNLYLDAGLADKIETGKTEQFLWLNRFGTMGTFLKNDIKLLRRNKRAKTTLMASVMFLFYGILFFSDLEMYRGPVWKIFAGIFTSGGLLFCFGQFVPSWDSAYYPLMMSQNIKYKDYLRSKWWLMVVATIATTILSSFYLYFGVDAYLAILAGAVYNIGVNAHIVLWGGAYIKTPIDLASAKNAFGSKQSFNFKTILLSLPKLLLPMALYGIGAMLFDSSRIGFVFVVGAGIIGFAFRDKVFGIIENIYRKEKYKTLAAYKEKV